MTIAAILLSKVGVATAIAVLAEVVRRRSVRPEPAYGVDHFHGVHTVA